MVAAVMMEWGTGAEGVNICVCTAGYVLYMTRHGLRGSLSARKVWLDMVSTRWRQIVHSLYAIKREAWKWWGWGLSFNVVFEKNVFVRRVRCLALLEFLYAFPSPYTLGRQGNAKDDDGDSSMHTYIHTYIHTYANTGDVSACRQHWGENRHGVR